MRQIVFEPTVDVLARTLDRVSQRGAVVAANLANVDTPGYRAMEVVFDDVLRSQGGLELLRTEPGHLGHAAPAAPGTAVESAATRAREDGNTVDLDQQMTLLAALQGRYTATTQMLRKRFALLEYAVTSGGSR